MKILYLSNKEVPYRVEFFNLLAKEIDLTVVYDTRQSGDRDREWATSIKSESGLKTEFLPDGHMRQLGRLHNLLSPVSGFDIIVIGCINTFTGIAATAICRMRRLRYMINLDGEIFFDKSIRSSLKEAVLSGASGYLVAGKAAARSIAGVVGGKPVFPYSFSSIRKSEIKSNARLRSRHGIPDPKAPVLVVGQYVHAKGLDVAVAVARADRSIPYIFVGAGSRAEQFKSDFNISPDDTNITVIPFLQKADLTEMYLRCSMMLLPSRKECWGLVVNEAASLGTPIVSTSGSGSAVEILSETFPDFVVRPGEVTPMLNAIKHISGMTPGELRRYSESLIDKASDYTIETSVAQHVAAFRFMLSK